MQLHNSIQQIYKYKQIIRIAYGYGMFNSDWSVAVFIISE